MDQLDRANVASNVPNCFSLVMLRQASKLLIRLLEPQVILNCCLMPSYAPPPQPAVTVGDLPVVVPVPTPRPEPSPEEQAQTARALERLAAKPDAEARHWHDYLARYVHTPGCWAAGLPRSASFCARVRPVFLYRNVRRCVDRLTQKAVRRRQQELVDTGDTQPEEVRFLLS